MAIDTAPSEGLGDAREATVSKGPRVDWVDDARGIGIFLVVLGHTLHGLNSGGLLEAGRAYRFVDSWIYAFHMPLFFFLSGLFLDRQVARGGGAFVGNKLATLAYPYFVWSTIQTLVQVAMGRFTNSRASLSDLAWIAVEPIMQFWFLYALFLISVAYLALRRLGLGPVGALAAFAVFRVVPLGPRLSSWIPLNTSRENGIFVALGSVFNRYGGTARVALLSSAVLAAIAVLGFGAIAAAVSQPWATTLGAKVGLALCGIAASVATAVLVGRAGGPGFIRQMGLYSLEIFVAHTIASAGLRIALQKFLRVDNPAAHIVLGTAAGIVLPMLLAWLCRRYHAEFVFQLKPRRAPSPRA